MNLIAHIIFEYLHDKIYFNFLVKIGLFIYFAFIKIYKYVQIGIFYANIILRIKDIYLIIFHLLRFKNTLQKDILKIIIFYIFHIMIEN